MAIKYYLNTAVHFYSKYSGFLMLTSSEKSSYNRQELEKLMDELPGNYYKGEYVPKESCIKYSASLLSFDGKEVSENIVEKYYILDLRDHFPEFWSLFNNLKLKEK